MGRKEGTAQRLSSEIVDIEDRTDPDSQTERPSVMVVGRSATIRQILYIILSSCGFKVVEADHWAPVIPKALPSGIRLVLIDAESDHFPDEDLDRLDERVAADVPAIVLTDHPEAAQARKNRSVIAIPRIFTWERIVSVVQMASLLYGRPIRL
jgi:DNA-binding NtrC family response regulator